MRVIWGKREAEYFWGRGLDGANQVDLVGKLVFGAGLQNMLLLIFLRLYGVVHSSFATSGSRVNGSYRAARRGTRKFETTRLVALDSV